MFEFLNKLALGVQQNRYKNNHKRTQKYFDATRYPNCDRLLSIQKDMRAVTLDWGNGRADVTFIRLTVTLRCSKSLQTRSKTW